MLVCRPRKTLNGFVAGVFCSKQDPHFCLADPPFLATNALRPVKPIDIRMVKTKMNPFRSENTIRLYILRDKQNRRIIYFSFFFKEKKKEESQNCSNRFPPPKKICWLFGSYHSRINQIYANCGIHSIAGKYNSNLWGSDSITQARQSKTDHKLTTKPPPDSNKPHFISNNASRL